MRNPRYYRAIFMLLALFIGCTGTANEEKAEAIFQQAQSLEKQGRIIEALQEYDRLVDYKDTKAFETAKAHLVNDGISIGKGIHSWSIKKMFTVKNRMLQKGDLSHPDGNVVVPLSTRDGWGSYMRVEYSTGPKFYFSVISLGPDKKLDTNDDLRVYHEKGAQGRAASSSRGGASRNKNMSHLAESSVELDDLVKGKSR